MSDFEFTYMGNEHKIESAYILSCEDTGRVVSVFYNDYDLRAIEELQVKSKQLEQEVKELKSLQEKYVWITREEMKEYSDLKQLKQGQE